MNGFRRIPWVEDEIILALDLYFREGPLDDAHSKVVELSGLLRKLPIHPVADREHPKFRNPNGVSLKLKNFLPLDPGYEGVGMTSYSHADERLFNHYFDRRDELTAAATAIRSGAASFPMLPVEEEEEDSGALEGRLLIRRHVARERDRKLRNRKVARSMAELGRIPCEVCGIEFSEFYGEVGRGYIEVHHRLPLAESGPRRTRLEDLALVCPNCHRMLHRDRTATVETLRDQVRSR